MNPERLPFFNDQTIQNISEIEDGTDTILKIETSEGMYILKSHSFDGLTKEEFETEANLLKYLSNFEIPTPLFHTSGVHNQTSYIITGYKEGEHPNFEKYTEDELYTFIEQYFKYDAEINSIPLPSVEEYGALTDIDSQKAEFKTGYKTWREFFLTMTGYLVDDISVSDSPYTEEEVTQVHNAIIQNSSSIPEKPMASYIHFDYRPGNILALESGEITSVLDWAKGLIGDNHFSTIEAYFYLTYSLEQTPHSRDIVPSTFTKQITPKKHHIYMLFFYLCEMSAFNIWMAPFTEEERIRQYETSKEHIQEHLSELDSN